MEEVDFSTILRYHSIEVGDLFRLTGKVKSDDHTHVFIIISKAKRIAELEVKICKCAQNDPVCVVGRSFKMSFDELTKMRGLYINTDMYRD